MSDDAEQRRRTAGAAMKWEAHFQKIEMDLLVLKTMLAVVVAGVVSLVLKAYFT